MGQSKAGISNLCMTLEWVQDRVASALPWKAFSKERTLRFGQPGPCKCHVQVHVDQWSRTDSHVTLFSRASLYMGKFGSAGPFRCLF